MFFNSRLSVAEQLIYSVEFDRFKPLAGEFIVMDGAVLSTLSVLFSPNSAKLFVLSFAEQLQLNVTSGTFASITKIVEFETPVVVFVLFTAQTPVMFVQSEIFPNPAASATE